MKNIWFHVFLFYLKCNSCFSQKGPDPWDYESHLMSSQFSENIPPDLRHIPKKIVNTENNVGMSEWFFKRILVIVLKGGQVKVSFLAILYNNELNRITTKVIYNY